MIRGSTLATSAGSTAVAISPVAGTTTGDVVIVIVNWNDTNTETIADNNGSTPFTKDLAEFRNNGTVGHDAAVFSRRIQAGDPSTYNFTLSASQRWTAVAVTIQNPHPSAIYDVAPASGNCIAGGSSNPVTVPGITTLNANAIHFSILCTDGINNTTTATPAGYTQQQNGGEKLVAVFTKQIASPGATGTTQFSDSLGVTKTGISFSSRESPSIDLAGSVSGVATATAALTTANNLAGVLTATGTVQANLTVYFVALMGLLIGRGVLGATSPAVTPTVPLIEVGHRTRIVVTL